MKHFLTITLLLLFNKFGYCQADSSYALFIQLVDKVQHDKDLRGTFIYKGSKAEIDEYTEYKTAIGKFLRISWSCRVGKELPSYVAIYHTTFGYMTRSLFNRHAKHYTKETKNKYCKGNNCIALLDDS